MSVHETLQRGIERLFFKGKSTKDSGYAGYVIGNVFLMLVLFYLVLNTLAYDWTGQFYHVGSGFNLFPIWRFRQRNPLHASVGLYSTFICSTLWLS